MGRRGARVRLWAGLFGVAAVALAGCGEDDGGEVRNLDGTGTATGAGTGSGSATGAASATGGAACEPVRDAEGARRVEVALNEWSVAPTPADVAAGRVVFVARNVGKEPHELVVAQAASPAELTVKDGKVDESALPSGALKGEIEGFAAGKTCEGAFELAAGSYVLFCNIAEKRPDGIIESHFEQGMATTFTVRP